MSKMNLVELAGYVDFWRRRVPLGCVGVLGPLITGAPKILYKKPVANVKWDRRPVQVVCESGER